jgi:hypothetical protein
MRAFAFFGGSCRRGIYDNLKTVVTKILQGKDRLFNRRFQQLASHYLVEPVACTPAAGWEKGQVENQVSFLRRRVFTPRLQFADLTELNQWLADRCHTLAAGHPHPECKDRTVAAYFAEEQSRLLNVRAPFGDELPDTTCQGPCPAPVAIPLLAVAASPIIRAAQRLFDLRLQRGFQDGLRPEPRQQVQRMLSFRLRQQLLQLFGRKRCHLL